jgi:thiol peroxidase
MKGNPLDLVGPALKVGDKAPDFACATVQDGLKVFTLKDTEGKARLFSVVPSLDTPVCNRQTKHLAETLTTLGDKVAAYTISTDLPFGQVRFCTEAGISNMKNLSDLHDQSFGAHYGVKIDGLPVPLLARALFVVDGEGTITHVEYVPEIATEPDYDPAIAALKAAAGV